MSRSTRFSAENQSGLIKIHKFYNRKTNLYWLLVGYFLLSNDQYYIDCIESSTERRIKRDQNRTIR